MKDRPTLQGQSSPTVSPSGPDGILGPLGNVVATQIEGGQRPVVLEAFSQGNVTV